MTLARRMWLASAALALLVGAAFTALILAVSAQREAADRETRSKDVTAASLQLETARLGRRVELPQLRVRREGRNARDVPQREATGCTASSRVVATSREGRPEPETPARAIENADPGVRVRLRPAAGPDPAGDTGDQPRRRHRRTERQAADERDPAALQRLPARDENKLAAQAARDADERTDIAVLVGAIAVGASMALIVLFGIVLARSIGRPVRAVADGAGRIAGGELSLRLPEEGPGEVGELTRAFNEMAERLEVTHDGARAAERGAARERAQQDRARQHRLPRAADAARERARVHGAPAQARVRPADAAALPRHRRRAGAPAGGAARGLPRRAADRARGRRPGDGEGRPGEPARRAGAALRRPEPEAPARGRARGAAADRARRPRPARAGRR